MEDSRQGGVTIQSFAAGVRGKSMTAEQGEREEAIKRAAVRFSQSILMNTSTTREQSLSLTKLEESLQWALSAVAREPTINGLAGRKTLFAKISGLMTGPAKKKIPALSVAEIRQCEMWLNLTPLVDEEIKTKGERKTDEHG